MPLQRPRFSEGIETSRFYKTSRLFESNLAETPLFIPPQGAPFRGAGGMSTVLVARGGRESKTKEKRKKTKVFWILSLASFKVRKLKWNLMINYFSTHFSLIFESWFKDYFCLLSFFFVLSFYPVARGGKEGIAEPREGPSLPVALEARGVGDEGRFNFYKGGLAETPFFIPPQSAPFRGAGGMSTVPVARRGKKAKTKEKRKKTKGN